MNLQTAGAMLAKAISAASRRDSGLWVWANVLDDSPLQVELDGYPGAVINAAANGAGPLVVGDRVFCRMAEGRLDVVARGGGTAGVSAATASRLVLRDPDGRTQMVGGVAPGGVAIVDQLPQRNAIINGTFRTNQAAYVSGTDVASGVYGPDMWKATTANSRLNFTADPYLGQTVTIPSGDSWGQVVERGMYVPGVNVMSWPGASQGRIYKVGDTPPAYADGPIVATLDGTAHYMVEFGPGTVSVDDEGVKLEPGTVPTPFVLDPIDAELEKCYRYYYTIKSTGAYKTVAHGAAFSGGFHVLFWLPVAMRATPTLTSSGVYGQTNFGTPQAASGVTMDGNNDTRVAAIGASASGLTANAFCRMLLTTNGYLRFDARL